jgi:hypothetical protein
VLDGVGTEHSIDLSVQPGVFRPLNRVGIDPTDYLQKCSERPDAMAIFFFGLVHWAVGDLQRVSGGR